MSILFIFTLPPTVGANIAYNLRNPNNIQTVHAISQLYFNFFLPSVFPGWNELPEDVRNSDYTTALRRFIYLFSLKQCLFICLNTDLNLPLRYYYVGKRLGQILHSRLRNKCSSLKHLLFSKNIIQSLLCACGATEDSKQILLDCPLHINLRQQMIRVISNLCIRGDIKKF